MKNSFENPSGRPAGENPEEKLEEINQAYKTAPGEYKEWAMSALNRAVAEMEVDYPELKSLKHQIKDWWVRRLVWVLVSESNKTDKRLSIENLEDIKGVGEQYAKELIERHFTGDRKLDELLWEKEME